MGKFDRVMIIVQQNPIGDEIDETKAKSKK